MLTGIILLVIAALAVFDLLALGFGVDSRESIVDDRRRTIR
jgi:hypothetical protein